MTSFKPMLAEDAVLEKLQFPAWQQPKIDGVRTLNRDGVAVGRSLKKPGNLYVQKRFGGADYHGLDGEMIVGANPQATDLCRATTSALSTQEGSPVLTWYVFDYLTAATMGLCYEARYEALLNRLNGLGDLALVPMPFGIVENLEQVLEQDKVHLEVGYEGSIVRRPDSFYKHGRSTLTKCEVLRIKTFADDEAEIIGFEEGRKNLNEAKTNELGHTERSSHKANQVPNGQIGSLTGRVLTGIFKDQVVTISPGRMTVAEATDLFQNPQKLLGRISKFRHFPVGVKDKPRFPTHQMFRERFDMSEG
jgi:DNA ligase-1